MKCVAVAKKVSLFFLTLSLIGWIVFLVGTCRIVKVLVDADISVFTFYFSSIWAEVVVGLVVFCLPFAYTLTGGMCSYVLGSITAFLAVLFIVVITANRTAVAYVIVLLDYSGHTVDITAIHTDVHQSLLMMFFGGIATTFFWAIYQTIWPWFMTESRTHTTETDTDIYSTA
ncbi:hypothetical protein GBAR_LOCUS20159 [Geodia barretti]|uniref:Uncharacterized protein n=1 Tax=Geodia barretti TaxID=519541 RepID=A0AA35SUH3_GEOBA|nr:hypothetical protein GBAR_LOCUS20159 [Geodia barretti]